MHTIIVIGAARSGTKILRDTVAEGLGLVAIPYDMGYVWTGKVRHSTNDAIPVECATESVRTYIRDFYSRYTTSGNGMVEKTVGNTLRVPFVQAIFPDATYVHLIRDGVDVVESAARQWRSNPDMKYILRKLGHFPLRQIPTYGAKYAANLLKRGSRSSDREPSWGPRYPGIDSDIASLPLEVVCARQWVQCVQAAQADLAAGEPASVTIRYEAFVRDPVSVMEQIADRAGIQVRPEGIHQASSRVAASLGGRQRSLPEALHADLASEMNSTLSMLGYEEL